MKLRSSKNVVLAFVASALAFSSLSVAVADIPEKDFASAMEKFLQSDTGVGKMGEAMERYFQKKQQMAMKEQEDKSKSEMEEQFKNPVKVDIGTSPVKGPANAKVTVVEFSDFQCPYCRRGHETMLELAKAYPNDVKFVFKHYPLPFHKQAEPAARATWAAQQQGKFWEYHDALFKAQDKLGEEKSAQELFVELAKSLSLNVDKFKTDMASEAAAKSVKEDAEFGAKNGIQGTPGYFVNGVAVRGAYPLPYFKDIVDRWLNGGVAKKS